MKTLLTTLALGLILVSPVYAEEEVAEETNAIEEATSILEETQGLLDAIFGNIKTIENIESELTEKTDD